MARKQTAAARYAQYSGLALLLPASTVVGYAIGYYLDKAFGTTWLQIVFLILGSVAEQVRHRTGIPVLLIRAPKA